MGEHSLASYIGGSPYLEVKYTYIVFFFKRA